MCSSRSDRALPALLALVGLTLGGCALDAGEYEFGFNITGLEFEFYDETEGVFPSDVTLGNPNNPYRDLTVFFLDEDATRFDVLTDGGNAGAFYYWATLLARVPIGEHQFLTATKLRDIALSGELENEVEQCRVKHMAGDAFQAVLDEFPESVLFTPDGLTPIYLAPLAFQNIQDLGLEVKGDWVLAVGPNGEPIVTRISGSDLPRTEFPPPPGQEDFDPCMPR